MSWPWLAVVALLAIYTALALWATWAKGSAFDEGEQLAIGYDIWQRGDFRMEAANGDFVKRWATLPYLFSRPKTVRNTDPSWRRGDAYRVGMKFLFELGNDADSLLRQGRVMMILLGLATALLVHACARELFGPAGGIVALGVFVFSPNMLAFGAIVSTEMTLCFALLGSTWCVWRLLHRITWGRLAASLAMFAMLVLTKPTAVLLLPITAIMVALKLWFGRPLDVELGTRHVTTPRRTQGKYFLALTALHAALGWGAIWAHYGFHYDASANPADPDVASLSQTKHDPVPALMEHGIDAARRHRVFPEGFLHGVEWLLGHDDERHAFLAGEWTYGGWRHFFLRAALIKTRPAFLVFFVAGVSWWIWRRQKNPPPLGDSESGKPRALPSFYDAIPYFTILAVYVPAAIAQNLNIGHRHILPVYPAAYVLTGSMASLWTAARLWWRVPIAAWCVYFIAETFVLAPHFLAYFSPLVGGPAKGYTQLVDSSLDWGMNLPALRRWIDENNPKGREPFYLSYFGTDSPAYRGIACQRLPGFFDWGRGAFFDLKPGIYAVSATLLQTVYTRTFGPWNKEYEGTYRELVRELAKFESTASDPAARAALLKEHPPSEWQTLYSAFENLRFGRLCAWLRHRRVPDDNVGYSILIWRLSEADLREALSGPPVELAEAPVPTP